jgi:soluble P-type ATPase
MKMITILRPGQEPLEIEFILIDFEGTLAQDRRVHPKAKDKINLLSKRAKIYILTKEEKNLVEEALKRVKAEIVSFMEGEASQKKLDFLRQLGATRTVVIGNGADDVPMIEEAGLGICVLSKEGTFTEAMKRADLVFINILDALDFLLKPLRQKATLGC